LNYSEVDRLFTEHDIATNGQVAGLSSAEASRRLASSGPNAVPDRPMPAWRRLAKRFWGPLPWMLEGTATASVEATGAATSFGRAARLVQTSEPKTSLERVVFIIVRSLVALDIVLVAAMCVYAAATGASLRGVVPFALTLLIASVPVALPATFSVAQAIGALELSRESHVLVTRAPGRAGGGVDGRPLYRQDRHAHPEPVEAGIGAPLPSLRGG
jgi:magnesium-transporting ATPase (P-type)